MNSTPSPMLAEFEKYHGFTVGEHMDLQTEIAWHNWQVAWNEADKVRNLTSERDTAALQNKRSKVWPIGNRITATLKYEPRWPCFAFGFIGHKEFVLMFWFVLLSIRVGY